MTVLTLKFCLRNKVGIYGDCMAKSPARCDDMKKNISLFPSSKKQHMPRWAHSADWALSNKYIAMKLIQLTVPSFLKTKVVKLLPNATLILHAVCWMRMYSSIASLRDVVAFYVENEMQTCHEQKIVEGTRPRLHLLYAQIVILQNREWTER